MNITINSTLVAIINKLALVTIPHYVYQTHPFNVTRFQFLLQRIFGKVCVMNYFDYIVEITRTKCENYTKFWSLYGYLIYK